MCVLKYNFFVLRTLSIRMRLEIQTCIINKKMIFENKTPSLIVSCTRENTKKTHSLNYFLETRACKG